MATLTDCARVLTEEGGAAHAGRPLPMDQWVYGAIALALVVAALVIVWLFRHTAQVMIEGDAHRAHGGHGSHGGHGGHGTSGGGHH